MSDLENPQLNLLIAYLFLHKDYLDNFVQMNRLMSIGTFKRIIDHEWSTINMVSNFM